MPVKPSLRMLPNYFKKVGLVLVLLLVLAFLCLVIARPGMTLPTKELVRHIFSSVLILSMALIAVAREKKEDELIQALRMQAIAFSFVFIIGYPVVTPLVSMIMEGTWEMVSGQSLVITMLGIYLAFFSLLKYTR